MNIPNLEKKLSGRTFNLYPESKRDSVIYNYMFNGLSNRELDHKILELKPKANYDGFQSRKIMLFLGIGVGFKGIFKKELPEDVLNELDESGSEYDEIRDSIIRHLSREGKLGFSVNLDLTSIISISGAAEGKKTLYYTNKYERNVGNRNSAIAIHGTKCMACGFDFNKIYGGIGKGFIEVHHIKPLYSFDGETDIDPKEDLVCVCSNCHRMIHRKKEMILSIDEIKTILNEQITRV